MLVQLPEIATKRIAIKLRSSSEKMVKRKHPWIFEDGIVKQNLDAVSGDLCVIFDQKRNNFIASGLYDAFSPIKIKLLSFEKGSNINSEWFQEKINNAYHLRESLLETDTNSYRLINGENDSFPGFIADVYDHVLVVKLYSHCWFPYLKDILPKLIETSQCKTLVLRLSRRLQTKRDTYGLKDGQTLFGALESETIVFKEHGVRFSANVIKGHKTGYFLDHRENRRKVGLLSMNNTVLDVFSYAGGFSVHALANQATEVTSIDISAQALEMASENVALNKTSGKHNTIAIDAFEGLQNLIKEHKKFDIVVIDPPSFAKRQSEINKALHSYKRLTKLGVQLVSKNGVLVLASCSSRITSEVFFETVETTMIQANKSFQILEKTTHDIDHPITFPEGAYLKCGYYKIS